MDCEDHVVPPVKFLEPYDSNQSAASLTLRRRCSCAVDFWHIVVKPRRRKTTRTYCRFWKSRWNNELRCIGFGWLRSPISVNQESEDNIELLPLYHVPCVTLCHCSCQTTLTKRQKKKKKKKRLSDVSVDPQQSMRRPPKSAEIGVLRPGRSHIQAVFAPMAEEEGDIGLLSVVVWAFLAQCDHFLNKIEFVKDLSLRTKTCNKFFSQFLAEIVQR